MRIPRALFVVLLPLLFGAAAASAQTAVWGDLAYTSSTAPLQANQLCYSDGHFIRCDSSAAVTTGLLSDRIVSGTTAMRVFNNTSATIATAGVERIVIGTDGNVGIGQQPQANVTLSVNGNTAIVGRLGLLTSVSNNVIVGSFAGSANTGTYNVAMGQYALQNNSGNNSVAIGYVAGQGNTGANLTATGYGAGQSNQGTSVSAFGSNTAQNNTGGAASALGANAAQNNTGGYASVVGMNAGQNNSGNYLSGLGYNAGQFNQGANVVALGFNAAQHNTGANVTAVGDLAAIRNTANNVTALGYNAVSAVSNTFTNITGLGYDAQPTKSNQIMLGNTNLAEVFSYGAGVFNQYIRPGSATTVTLPSATTAGAGAIMYDTTTNGLKFSNGSLWLPVAGGGTLASLTDVSTSAATLGSVLQYNGTSWNAVSPSSLISGSQVAFKVHRNENALTGIVADQWNLVSFLTKEYDTNTNFNLTNNRFTPTIPGYYLFTGQATCVGGTACYAGVFKNGSQVSNAGATSASFRAVTSALIYMNGVTDYASFHVWPVGTTTVNGGYSLTNFAGILVNGMGSPGAGGGVTQLSGLTDVTLATPATGQVLTYNGSSWVNQALSMQGDRLTSGTLSVTANSDTNIISLTTVSTTWGYLGSTASYLPNLNAGTVSADAVRINTTAAACTSANAGTLRYTSATTTLELCTGTGWQPMGVGVPAGTISAFASTTCPVGWSEYTPARGRFLRGIDNGAGNDPDGTRTPGAAQADAFQTHSHKLTYYDNTYPIVSSGAGGAVDNAGLGQVSVFWNEVGGANATSNYWASNLSAGARAAAETRPKNVAVTYCQFNGTSNGWNNPLSGGGASTPAGSTGQLQYNTAGAMDASAGLTWTNASQLLTATNISTSSINGVPVANLGVNTLASLTDVSTSAAALGSVLQYNGTNWNAVSPSSLVSGSQVAFSVHRNNVNQTITSRTLQRVNWTTKAYDTNNNFNPSNGRFTPTVPGKYLFTASAYCAPGSTYCNIYLQKNGIPANIGHTLQADAMPQVTSILDMNGTTDYADIWIYNENGTTISGNPNYTYFQGALINGIGSPGTGGGVTALSGLTDVTLATPATGQVLTYNGSSWVNQALSLQGDRLTSGTLSVTANSDTSIISLTTISTTWGYLGSTASYLPNLNAGTVSADAVRINTTAAACTSANAGTLRYTSATTTLELCTGTGWQPMGVGIPAGTISAFASTTCPVGWSEYTPARGRFLRGIDNSAGNDPTGTRTPGATQSDATRAILWSYMTSGSGGSVGYGIVAHKPNVEIFGIDLVGNNGWVQYNTRRDLSQAFDATYGNNAETRPKNVAVTYCQFNGTSNGWNNPLSGGGASTPAGSTGQLQYNTAGSMDASAGLTWTNASQLLTATNISTSSINGVPVTSLGVNTLASLTDVSTSAAALGSILQYNGTRWNAVSPSSLISGSQVAFSVHRNGTHMFVPPGNTFPFPMTWTHENYDTEDSFSANRFTPKTPGKYLIYTSAHCPGPGSYCQVYIYKNGVSVRTAWGRAQSGVGDVTGNATAIVDMNGTTDYVQAYVLIGGDNGVSGNRETTVFEGVLINAVGGSGTGGGATALSGLTDVTLATPATGQVLTYNGTNWVNQALSLQGDRITSGTTGMYTHNNTSASIATAGVERVVVGTGGEVGIAQQPQAGTSLAVSGSMKVGASVQIGSAAGTDPCTYPNDLGRLRRNPTTGRMQLCVQQ